MVRAGQLSTGMHSLHAFLNGHNAFLDGHNASLNDSADLTTIPSGVGLFQSKVQCRELKVRL